MHLLDLFESTNEGYTVTRGIDRDRYQERRGLEGPFQTKSGKVVYYDKKEGKYYDPDSDMYIDHDDYAELDEGVGTYLKGAVLAGLLGMGMNQMASMTDAKNSPLGQAMAQAAEQGDQYAAKHLEKLDAYFDLNDTGSIKVLSQKYLGRTIESVYEEVASTKRTERILKLLRAKNPSAENDLEALILSFEKGQQQDRSDINTLYSQNRSEERDIEELEAELEAIKKRRDMNEDYYETGEQRELARLGRIIMDMGAKRDDDVGAAMGAVGNELTKYGSPEGVNSIKKLEQVTGQPESVIMKMMALAQKVQGDVAVGDETAGNDEEEVEESATKKTVIKVTNIKWIAEPGLDLPSSVTITLPTHIAHAYEDNEFDMVNDELEEKYGYTAKNFDYQFAESYQDSLKNKIGRASDEFDVGTNNYEVKIDGKPWKVFRTKASAIKAASTIEMKYGKKTEVYATRKPVSEGTAKDFDEKFRKHLDLYTKSQKVRDYKADKAQQNLERMKAMDPGNINPLIIDKPKAHRKARKAGVPQSVISTNRNPTLPEGLDHDIRIGDVVQTLKMGQMQGTVTGFSTKSGSTKVMFKHKSGKVYATPASNLKVIDSVNEVELDEAKKKPVPTKPDKWAYAKAQAKKKFDVYPSAYANAWAAKKYKELGGGWRMGKKK